jgi:Ca2+-binding EF-hand superfamily protein
MNSFVKFMRMMGVKSNATLISRIFNVMDVDISGSISFGEFMKYFDVLLQGDNDQKAEFSFMIIAVGNEKNIGKSSAKMTFNQNDLYQLLKIMRESETKRFGETLDKEDIQTLKNLAKNMMKMLKIGKNQDVTLKMFKEAIESDENVLGVFQKLGNGLESLMSYQGENKYTRTVRALRLVREKFEVVFQFTYNLEVGYTKYGIGQLIVGGLTKRGKKRKASKSKDNTFMNEFHNTLKVTKKLSKFASVSKSPSNRSIVNKGVPLSKGDLAETINLPSHKLSDENIPKPHRSPPMAHKLKFSGIEKDKEFVNSSMGVDDFFEDESNIKIQQIDGIDKKYLKKPNILKFKTESIVDFADIRRMINEIEEGIYAPKNQKIELYNKPNEIDEKPKRIDWKQMPTFRKVRRVPKPSSTLFEDFECFLGSRYNHENANDTTGQSEDEEVKQRRMKAEQDNFVQKILESKQYQESMVIFLIGLNS